MLLLLLTLPILIADKTLAAEKTQVMSGRSFAIAQVSSTNFRIEKSVPNIR